MLSVSSSEALYLIWETEVTRQINHEGLTSKGREKSQCPLQSGRCVQEDEPPGKPPLPPRRNGDIPELS